MTCIRATKRLRHTCLEIMQLRALTIQRMCVSGLCPTCLRRYCDERVDPLRWPAHGDVWRAGPESGMVMEWTVTRVDVQGVRINDAYDATNGEFKFKMKRLKAVLLPREWPT